MQFAGPGRLLRSARLLWDVPDLCAEAQLRLHALDAQPLVDAIERAGLPRASITVEGRLQALREFVDQHELDGLRDACSWLAQNLPRPERLVICHCDIQPINILVTNGAISGVVDWSQVVVGHPALDVGYTKMAFETVPLGMPRWLARPIAGIVSRRLLRTYTKQQPLRADAIAYFGVLRALFALAWQSAARLTGMSEPDVWDNPEGVRNLTTFVRSVTGIEVELPRDARRAADAGASS
jgi:aminoglycoside phosphotransferase (APT) family kinase protein